MFFRSQLNLISSFKYFRLISQRNSSTIISQFDPCTGCEIPCTKHATCPPEILKQVDQSSMLNSVEKYSRHLCIGQSISSSQWPKDVNNISGGYIKKLTRILEEKKDAIGYPIKLTSASISSSSFSSNEKADWYLFPDQIKLRNIHIEQIEQIIETLFIQDQSLLQINDDIEIHKLNGLWILVCCHYQRDQRCGIIGQILVDEIEKYLEKTNQINHVHCLKISHIGGHRFAGNVILYPSGTWYGRVLPCHIPLLIDAYTSSSELLKAKLKPLLRTYQPSHKR